jgi:hypothetical protein
MHLLYPRPPSTVARVSLVIVGTVAAIRPELDPQLVQLRVSKVRIVETGWVAKPARMVTLAVPLPTDPAIPSALDALVPGDSVRAFAEAAPQTLGSARALAGAHTVVKLLPR